jgi:thymidylate synthase (FAD)
MAGGANRGFPDGWPAAGDGATATLLSRRSRRILRTHYRCQALPMETKRPTIAAAEEILGGYFPVLDHGFVSLVDYMGSDEDIERAARVSYGYGTRKVSQTRGLIRYLRRHKHTTPSEMVEFKFHCAMPMFVARQWIRHRTACLAEGTEVYFDLPGGVERRGNQLYKLTVEDIWQRFQPTQNKQRPDKQRNPFFRRDRVRQMRIRQMNEDNLRIQHSRVVDVYRNGRKPVFRMTLADGKQIEATADHRFFFLGGWQTLKEAVGLKERNGRAEWRSGDHYIHVNGMELEVPALYQDESWLREQYHLLDRRIDDIADECGVSYHTIRKWISKHGLSKPYRWSAGRRPWNVGKRYRLGPRELSEEWKEANRTARSGAASNFWKGGTSNEREAIGRWTTQIANKIHARNSWTCQLCGEGSSELHCHHIVPVWADKGLARDEDNLTTLCATCHRGIAGRELELTGRLVDHPVKVKRTHPQPRVAWNKMTVARKVRILKFEYVGIRETYDLEVEGPHHNFVANGIVTHNSVNEYSGRYSLMPLLFYRPPAEQFALQSTSNRQGRAVSSAPEELYADAIKRWEQLRAKAADTYGWLVDEDVARELARIDLPLSTYTQWYWKIDLHNLIHFLTLRVDPHAQWEIQQFARVMAGMLQRVAPLSYEAWIDYDLLGDRLTFGERRALGHFLEEAGDGLRVKPDAAPLAKDDLKALGLMPREARELFEKLSPPERPDYSLDLTEMRSAEHIAELMEAAVPGSEDE